MRTVADWIQRKLGLKVNMEKTHITRPQRLKYRGFGFCRDSKKMVHVIPEQLFLLIKVATGKEYPRGTPIKPLATEFPVEHPVNKEISFVLSDVTAQVGGGPRGPAVAFPQLCGRVFAGRGEHPRSADVQRPALGWKGVRVFRAYGESAVVLLGEDLEK